MHGSRETLSAIHPSIHSCLEELTHSSATYCKDGCHHGSLYRSPYATSTPPRMEDAMIKINDEDFMPAVRAVVSVAL